MTAPLMQARLGGASGDLLASAEPSAKPGSAIAPGATAEAWAGAMGMIDTTGVIPSVVRALIEEAGGRLDELYASSVKSLYRICLPHASKSQTSYMTPLKSVIKGQFRLKQWKILLASSSDKFAWLENKLQELGAVVEKKSSIDEVLGVIDSKRKPDVIIVDKRIFGDDAESLLKAVRKISPNSGVVIMSGSPEEELLRNERGFIFLESDRNEDAWLDAIVRSRQT
jgi:CheY-like chemotaxis protein